MKKLIILLSAIIVLQSCQHEQAIPADLIITNAVIWTGNEKQPSAKTMVIRGDKIIAIGNDALIETYQSEKTKLLNIEGKFVAPGFIDSHVHLMTGGRSLLSVDLRNANSPQKFSQLVGDFAASVDKGEWILEGNWDHTLWGGELPHRAWIDEVTGDNPVLLMRLDWHMALANTAALEYAGIGQHTADVDGGTIVRDADGQLTGILKDNAMNLVMDKIPAMSEVYKNKSFQAAMDYFLAQGVTSVHDVDGLNKYVSSFETAKQFYDSKKLKVRIYAAGILNEAKRVIDLDHRSDAWIKTGALKGFVDGSLGSHTAAFHDHYTDAEDDKGFLINETDDLYEWISEADAAGLHVLVHAIGDSANHALLNIFERVIKENGPKDRRFRIEHAQHLTPKDIERFSHLGVIASMQPYHAIDDGRWAESYIGAERIKTTYAFKSLLDAGATLAFGSDWAVAPASPIMGIYAAATRKTLDDQNPDGWVPAQKITAEQALMAYTKHAAYASFEEEIKGTLEVGKLADFVILTEDITRVKADKIKDIQVFQTFVAGEQVYNMQKQ